MGEFQPPSAKVVSAEPFSHGTGTLRCLQKEMATYRHWSVSLWWDPDGVSHCRILSPDKTEWRLISATLCGWRHCFVADQLWLMTRIREEEDWESFSLPCSMWHFFTLEYNMKTCFIMIFVIYCQSHDILLAPVICGSIIVDWPVVSISKSVRQCGPNGLWDMRPYLYILPVTFDLSRVFHSQPEYGWLTRPRLSCHIWKLIMQLGQLQPAFANRKESWVRRVVRLVMSGYSVVNRARFSFNSWLAWRQT